MSEPSFSEMRRYLLEPEFLRRCSSLPSFYRSADEWWEATIKTLVARDHLSDLTGFNYFDCFEILMQDVPQTQEMPHRMDFERRVLSSVSQIYGTMHWSTLCLTKNGLLGRLPYGSQPGDFGYVFARGPVPFVLRRRTDPGVGHMVMDPCYLDGIMNGEAAHPLYGEALMDLVFN